MLLKMFPGLSSEEQWAATERVPGYKLQMQSISVLDIKYKRNDFLYCKLVERQVSSEMKTVGTVLLFNSVSVKGRSRIGGIHRV